MKRIIKWILKVVGSVIALILVIGLSFLYFSPQFGRLANDEQIQEYQKTGHFSDGKFLNKEEIVMELNCHSITQMFKEIFEPDPNIAPKKNIEVQKIEPKILVGNSDSLVRLTWFGHSTFLVEMDGKIILLDPVFGKYAAPHPLLGRERYNHKMPITIEDLPQIDAIIISHDHYDHLDYPSIKKLKLKTKHFFVPLGVGNHLREWGIEDENITEMDWWQEDQLDAITIAFTPSRHMSGRGLSDQSATLWGSWVLQSSNANIYFSGDGGYGTHFKEIGEKYGPFDLGLMECGQYNKLWADVHMMPEQTVKAAQDVGAKQIIPIHWGAFSLATHSWTDPIERITKEAKELQLPIATPQIGEPFIVGDSLRVNSNWWRKYY
jgi:L-ascorbate metabolism protein UlaG (beta-lactamase superfamily)